MQYISKELAQWLKERGCEAEHSAVYDGSEIYIKVFKHSRNSMVHWLNPINFIDWFSEVESGGCLPAYSWYDILVCQSEVFFGSTPVNENGFSMLGLELKFKQIAVMIGEAVHNIEGVHSGLSASVHTAELPESFDAVEEHEVQRITRTLEDIWHHIPVHTHNLSAVKLTGTKAAHLYHALRLTGLLNNSQFKEAEAYVMEHSVFAKKKV